MRFAGRLTLPTMGYESVTGRAKLLLSRRKAPDPKFRKTTSVNVIQAAEPAALQLGRAKLPLSRRKAPDPKFP
jgi:hypothetical protein